MTEVFGPLADLAGLGEIWLWPAFAVFLRVGAVMALAPGFGEQSVPMRIRLALTLAFTATILPAVAAGITPQPSLLGGAAEIASGLMLGAGLRLFIAALQMAGMIAAQSVSLSQLFAAAGAEPQPAIGNVLTLAGLALAMTAGLHVKLASLLILSYDLLPAGALPGSADAAAWGLARIAEAFGLAFSLAAPFVLGGAVYNLALGMMNRAFPQLMVSFIGAPALTAGGLVLLALIAVPVLSIWMLAFDRFLLNPLGGIE